VSVRVVDLNVIHCVFFGDFDGILEGVDSLSGSHNVFIVQIDFVHAVVHFVAIQLAEDVLSELLVGDRVACLVLPDHRFELSVNRGFSVSQFGSEGSDVSFSRRILFDGLRDLRLEGVQSGVDLRRLLRSASNVGLLHIVGAYLGFNGPLLLLLRNSEGLLNLVEGAVRLVSANIALEFWRCLYADLLSCMTSG